MEARERSRELAGAFVSTDPATAVPAPRRRARARRWVVYPAVLLGLLLAALLYPSSFQAMVRFALETEAQRRSGQLTMDQVTGSVFEPIDLRGLHFRHRTAGRAATKVDLDRVTLQFNPHGLISRTVNFFEALEVEGGEISMTLAASGKDGPKPPGRNRSRGAFLPMRFSVRDVDVAVSAGVNALKLTNLSFGAEVGAMGPFRASELSWDSPRFHKSLHQVSGRTDLRNDWLSIVSLRLADEVVVENASMQVRELAEGRLEAVFDVTAFHGSVRGQGQMRLDRSRPRLDASGVFYAIDVAQLAHFLEAKVPARGSIDEGKFSFNGPVFEPEKASGSMRLKATDFEWGQRHWDALVAAGTLQNRRLKVTEFKIEQAENSLSATGEMQLGGEIHSLMESDFRLDLQAEIDDLSAIGALIGPDAAKWKGRLTAEGSVRGANKRFYGQIIMEGRGLRYGETPIDELHAALRLDGNDLELTNFDLIRGDDYVRGRGGIKILGERHYWGEARMAVADLAAYAEFPAPPFSAWPLRGSARGQWSGDGSRQGHSGAVDLQVRELVTDASAKPLPLDVDVKATYSPDNIYVTRGRIGHGDLFLTTEINASPDRTEFLRLALKKGKQTQVSGDVAVPIGFARRKPGESPMGDIVADLKLDDFHLEEAWRLAGLAAPASGRISGQVKTSGGMENFAADGKLVLKEGAMEESLVGVAAKGLAAEVNLEGAKARVVELEAHLLGGNVAGAGDVNLHNLRDPNLRLGMTGRALEVARGEVRAKGDFALTATGLVSQAYVDGTVQLTQLKVATAQDPLALLLASEGEKALHPVWIKLISPLDRPPLDGWRYDLEVTSEKPLQMTAQTTMTPDLRVRGTPANLEFGGKIDFSREGEGAEMMEGTYYLLDQPFIAARSIERKQEFLLVGPSYQPGKVPVADDFSLRTKVWPETQRPAQGPMLDSLFQMALPIEPPAQSLPHGP